MLANYPQFEDVHEYKSKHKYAVDGTTTHRGER
jgi:hypothetical protein